MVHSSSFKSDLLIRGKFYGLVVLGSFLCSNVSKHEPKANDKVLHEASSLTYDLKVLFGLLEMLGSFPYQYVELRTNKFQPLFFLSFGW